MVKTAELKKVKQCIFWSIITLITFVTLLGCTPTSDTDLSQMYLTRTSIERLFEDGVAFVESQNRQQSFSMYCHVVEGSWCYFVEINKIEVYDGLYNPDIDNIVHQIEPDFAHKIITELNPIYIEHSKNNGVKVYCTQALDMPDQIACQVDRGEGWQSLGIK